MTKKILIEKLTNNNSKAWYKKGTLAHTADRVPGDKRFVFSKVDMKFTIQSCNELLKWVDHKNYHWDIVEDGGERPTGFNHLLLKIDNQFTPFRFDNSSLILKLKDWQHEEILF